MNKQTMIVVSALVAILSLAAGFFAGIKYQQSKRGQFAGQILNGQGRGNGNRTDQQGRQGFRPVAGEILKSDDTSITVKLTDGSSKIIMITDKTEINKAQKGEKTDLTTGTNVAVFGIQNSDGSITAQNIQLNPNFQNRPGIN